MRGEDAPEGGYAGEYVGELAAELAAEGLGPDDLERLAVLGTEAMRKRIAATLERFGVRFDLYFSERTLHEADAVEAAVAELRERGHVYDSEGAVWLRTTEFGDDKDRVLIREDGVPTYFAADIAYHRDKLAARQRLIDPARRRPPRLRAAHARERSPPSAPTRTPTRRRSCSWSTSSRAAQRARMSKRKGEFVDPRRAARRHRRRRGPLLHAPAQPRHRARPRPRPRAQPVAGQPRLLRPVRPRADLQHPAQGRRRGRAGERRRSPRRRRPRRSRPAEPSERALVRRLLEFPGEVVTAAERRAPHRLCAYATATAADFHGFYRDCQVVGAGDGLEPARLAVCVAARDTIAGTLGLLGVGAPERM